MSGLMMTEVPSVESFAGLDITQLLCLCVYISEFPPGAAIGGAEGCALVLLVSSKPWWQHSYCTLWENFEVKKSSFLFFTSLLLPLQFYLTYKLCTVCLLEIVWVLSFMLSKCFFFLHCFRSLCVVCDSECYLWGFDLLPYSLKSSQSIYVFCFVLSEPHSPHKLA